MTFAIKRLAAAALILASVLAIGATKPGIDWSDYDGPGAMHYSPADQINRATISRLGLAWHYEIDVGGDSMTAPVAVNGVLYFAAGGGTIHALDARSGKLLWKYDTHAREQAGEKMRVNWGSRGIAFANGRLFFGTLDGRLLALDPKTGRLLWSVMTTGENDGRYITGAPWVFKNTVVIGHGGADFAPVRGYVTAYDQATGKQKWRFYTVPGDPAKGFENKAMAMAATTWTGQWWKYGGGGTVWNAMAYDPKYNRIYLGTGNGSPWNRHIRSPGGGDNLFLCAIVALDADTGEYVWHYQTNPGESWDFNSAMDIELADLKIGGRERSVILHAPKNGFFYVIDRADGKLISAEPFVPVNWASAIDPKTGRPIENPAARFPDGKAALVSPTMFGAHNVEAMSFSPRSGLAYIPAIEASGVYLDAPGPLDKWTFLPGARLSNGIGDPPPDLRAPPPKAWLIAWNPVAQKEAWRIPATPIRGSGATVATAGDLVFQGRAAGQFTALDAYSGKTLWSFDAQTAVTAQPITYTVAGSQYVTVIAGSRSQGPYGLKPEWNYAQGWRVLTFMLDAKATLPKKEIFVAPLAVDERIKIDPANVPLGQISFAQRCSACHGPNGLSGGAAPDLLRSQIPVNADAFALLLKEGPLVSRGMPRFADIDPGEREALRQYIQQRVRDVASGQPVAQRPGEARGVQQ